MTLSLMCATAMHELAEKPGMDPVQLRSLNDIQYDPSKSPSRPFRDGAERFGPLAGGPGCGLGERGGANRKPPGQGRPSPHPD